MLHEPWGWCKHWLICFGKRCYLMISCGQILIVLPLVFERKWNVSIYYSIMTSWVKQIMFCEKLTVPSKWLYIEVTAANELMQKSMAYEPWRWAKNWSIIWCVLEKREFWWLLLTWNWSSRFVFCRWKDKGFSSKILIIFIVCLHYVIINIIVCLIPIFSFDSGHCLYRCLCYAVVSISNTTNLYQFHCCNHWCWSYNHQQNQALAIIIADLSDY